jgi:hypothetical protein
MFILHFELPNYCDHADAICVHTLGEPIQVSSHPLAASFSQARVILFGTEPGAVLGPVEMLSEAPKRLLYVQPKHSLR